MFLKIKCKRIVLESYQATFVSHITNVFLATSHKAKPQFTICSFTASVCAPSKFQDV